MGEIQIRARQPGDLDGCVCALVEVFRTDFYPARWPSDPRRFLDPVDTLHGWVADDPDAGIVGQVIVRAGAAPGLASVSRLFVVEAARGAQVGFQLLGAARNWAATARFTLTLEVDDAAPAAIALYERTGWLRVRTEQADWTDRHGAAVTLHHYELHAE